MSLPSPSESGSAASAVAEEDGQSGSDENSYTYTEEDSGPEPKDNMVPQRVLPSIYTSKWVPIICQTVCCNMSEKNGVLLCQTGLKSLL